MSSFLTSIDPALSEFAYRASFGLLGELPSGTPDKYKPAFSVANSSNGSSSDVFDTNKELTKWMADLNQALANNANEFSKSEREAAQQFNERMADKTNAFNALQADISRKWSSKEAEIARKYNSAEAAVAREWYEKMSNSAYQRAAVDLKRAGLNPYLAYSQGGSSSTSGAAASAGIASASSASGVSASVSGARAAQATAKYEQFTKMAAEIFNSYTSSAYNIAKIFGAFIPGLKIK